MARIEIVLLFGLLAICTEAKNVTMKYEDVISFIRDTSDADIIPVERNDPRPVEVSLRQTLLYIVRVDEEQNSIELVLKHAHSWTNRALAWDRNVPELDLENATVPARYLWIPDLTPTSLLNFPEQLTPETAIVNSEGVIVYEPELRLHLHVNLQGLQTNAGANITIPYQSWSYDNSQLTLAAQPSSSLVTSELETTQYAVADPRVTKEVHQSTKPSQSFDRLNFSFILRKLL